MCVCLQPPPGIKSKHFYITFAFREKRRARRSREHNARAREQKRDAHFNANEDAVVLFTALQPLCQFNIREREMKKMTL
jgi:hypothetical protein